MGNSSQKLWTPANKVTLARILLIPLFVAAVAAPWPVWFPQWPEAELWKPVVAALVFIVISATDAVDGHLARSRGEVTTLGKFMDPLADKLLVTAALLVLVEGQVLPSWVALIIIAREFIVSGIRMVAASEGLVIAASWWGKVKTVTQIAAIVLFLIKGTPLLGYYSQSLDDGMYLLAWFAMILAIFFTIASMLDYFRKARTLLGFGEEDGETAAAQAHSRAAEDLTTTAGWVSATKPSDVKDFRAEAAGGHAGATGGAGVFAPCIIEKATGLLDAARAEHKRVASAESCTGGLVSAALTAIPGSSDVVAGAIVSYSNEVKEARLGVPEETIETRGAVSYETACAMAEGACRELDVDLAVSVTGIAGPGGAVPGKPVGTVWIGICDHTGSDARVHHFAGSRDDVRAQTVLAALDMLATHIETPVRLG